MEIGQTNTDSFVSFCELNFKPGQANQTKELQLIAKRDFRRDGNQIMDLKINLLANLHLIDWIYHKKITNIKVNNKTLIVYQFKLPHIEFPSLHKIYRV